MPSRRRGRLPTLLLLVALLPLAGMLALAADSAQRLERERRDGDQLVEDVDEFVRLIEARTAVSAEEVASSVLTIGADLGVTAEDLSAMFDEDFVGELTAARTGVDADPTLGMIPALQDELTRLRALRPRVDRGTVTFHELLGVTSDLRSAIEEVWNERVDAQIRSAQTSALPASVQVRFQAMTAAHIALSAAADRALLTEVAIMGSPTPEQLDSLVDATGTFRAAAQVFPGRLGPLGQAAWEAHLADPAANRFLAVLDDTVTAIATGTEPPLRGDPAAFGNAYIDGPTWAEGISATVTAAAQDLRRLATHHADGATRAAIRRLVAVVILTVASLVAAVLVARAVTRPMRRLEAAAHRIHQGSFELDPVPEQGPREVADTARAFNEMSATLAAVERHAVALADDTEAPVLREALPGRTGRALQVALNRLRASMQVAEQRRQELELAATHDALTGLLNRAAAFEVVSRDLLRAERGGGSVVALFIDMDGLKPINDEHSHAAGDDALRLTADALRSATRASDVVARLGGDEFLVAGVLTDGGDDVAEAEELAERIRLAVRARAVRIPDDDPIPLRCTVGLAVASRDCTVESLIHEADAALLEAKRNGKDRIGWYSGRTPEAAER
ncbi:MAG: diguanylate cyclase [Acidimicrobiia bacterium]